MKSVCVSDRPNWQFYVNERFNLYREHVCSVPCFDVQVNDSHLIFPNDERLNDILDRPVDTSLAMIGKTERSWSHRPDYYEIAARYLSKKGSEIEDAFVFCFVEYARPDDGVLAQRQHIVHLGKVFLSAEVLSIEQTGLAKLMRQARSKITLGVITSEGNGPCGLRAGDIFFTDAFDGDAIIVSNLGKDDNL